MKRRSMLHGGMGDDPDGVRTFALTHKPRILPMAYSALDQASAAILRGPVYAEIAARHKVTPAQVALRWVTQHTPPVPLVAPSPAPNSPYGAMRPRSRERPAPHEPPRDPHSHARTGPY